MTDIIKYQEPEFENLLESEDRILKDLEKFFPQNPEDLEEKTLAGIIRQIENEVHDQIPSEIALPPEVLEAIYSQAHKFYETEQYEKAIPTFRFLLTLSPTTAKCWLGLGATHQMLKEYPIAIGYYFAAVELDSSDPYSPYYLAECLLANKEIEQAIVFLDVAKKRALKNKNKYESLIHQIDLLVMAWSIQETPKKAKKKSKKTE